MNLLSFFGKRHHPWMMSFFGGGNHAEEEVNEETVMQIGAAYACVRLIAESIASQPIGMVKIIDDGTQPAPDHPLHDLLSVQPNADQTAVEYWESVLYQIALRGNSFSLKRYNAKGHVIALDLLPDWPITQWRRETNGSRTCVVGGGRFQGEYSENDVLWFRGFGGDVDCGMSVIAYGANTFGRALAIERHSGKMLARGVRPNVILETEGVLTDKQRAELDKNIVKPFEGSEHAGGVMVLEGGFKMTPITLTPADAQLLEQMNFGVEEVCRWFRVSPSMIGHTERQTSWGTGLEQNFIAFVRMTLHPFTARIVQSTAKQLQTAADRKRYKPHILLDRLTEGDSATRSANLKTLVTSGIITQNEARRRLGYGALEGADGLRMQQQMVLVGGTENGTE